MNRSSAPSLTSAAEWAAVERLLDRDPAGEDFNTGHEISSRHRARSGVALTVVHETGQRERWTYSELDKAAARAAKVFDQLGLRRGDYVAGLLSRQVESWITAIAAWRSGLIYVPLFCGFGVDALGQRLNIVEPKVIVVDDSYLITLRQAQTHYGLDPAVLVVGAAAQPGLRSFWSEIADVNSDGPIRTTRLGDTATILFTSGTTGTPKGCRMTHAAFVATIPYVRHVLGTAGPVFSTADPGWTYGLLTTGASAMALGIHRVIYSGRFDPKSWCHVIRDEQVRVLATAPAALRQLTAALREDSAAMSTLRTLAVAGEPLPAAVAREWSDASGLLVRNGYGLSEVGMVLADLIGTEARITPGGLTAAVPGFDPVLVDANGAEVNPNEPGLIALRAPKYQQSSGYINAEGRWDARWAGDLFVTEDRASSSETGGWTVLGRDDDILVVSGHNISPAEVENAVLAHPQVAEAAAVPHEDPQRGHVIRLVIVPSNPAPDETLRQELVETVINKIGPFAKPRIIEYRASLPRTEVGKLRRRDLRS